MRSLSAVFPGEASFFPSIQKCSGFCPEISGRAFCSFPAKAFAEFNKTGELSDDELDNVSGGCYESGDTPKFSVGQHVGVCAGRGHAPARILSVSDKKHDGWCRNEQWIYSIKFDQGGEIRNDVYEDNIIEWND